MSPSRYSQLRYKLIAGQHLPAGMVAELVRDREYSHPRIEISQDDVGELGVNVEKTQAWLRTEFWIEDGRDSFVYETEHEYHSIKVRYEPVTVSIINVISKASGKPAIDVLLEIADIT